METIREKAEKYIACLDPDKSYFQCFEIDEGAKYFKIVGVSITNTRSAIDFIDKKTGIIYRANSWSQKGRKIGQL